MENLPRHIVIVPDGNRRWAEERGKSAASGHREGAKVAENILRAAFDLKIPYVTFWGSSVANVTERTPLEVQGLFEVFRQYFERLLRTKAIHEHRARVSVVGRWEELFPERLKKPIRALIDSTKDYTAYRLTFLMAYSGVEEMTDAVRRIAASARKKTNLKVTEGLIKDSLWTRDLPPVDLVIRTGGEPHWSAGLMMWDVAEARLHFTKTFWPAFSPAEFKAIIGRYAKTERRFGK